MGTKHTGTLNPMNNRTMISTYQRRWREEYNSGKELFDGSGFNVKSSSYENEDAQYITLEVEHESKNGEGLGLRMGGGRGGKVCYS